MYRNIGIQGLRILTILNIGTGIGFGRRVVDDLHLGPLAALSLTHRPTQEIAAGVQGGNKRLRIVGVGQVATTRFEAPNPTSIFRSRSFQGKSIGADLFVIGPRIRIRRFMILNQYLILKHTTLNALGGPYKDVVALGQTTHRGLGICFIFKNSRPGYHPPTAGRTSLRRSGI